MTERANEWTQGAEAEDGMGMLAVDRQPDEAESVGLGADRRRQSRESLEIILDGSMRVP